MAITDEISIANIYQAGMEDENRNFENQLFDKIPGTVTGNNKPAGLDKDAKNKNVSKLFSAENGQRIGPGHNIKVMAEDKFKAKVVGWYQPGTSIAVEKHHMPRNSNFCRSTSIVLSQSSSISLNLLQSPSIFFNLTQSPSISLNLLQSLSISLNLLQSHRRR